MKKKYLRMNFLKNFIIKKNLNFLQKENEIIVNEKVGSNYVIALQYKQQQFFKIIN